MPAKNNDLLSAQSLRSDDTAQSHSPVADNGHTLSWCHPRDDRGMVSSAHHVRQREQRWHKRIVCVRADWKESSIRQRNSYRFGLCSSDLCSTEKSAMDTRRLKPVVAKHACAVGERERHDNEITAFNRSNICTDVFDHTYRFVPHYASSVAALHFLIWPQIAPANARARDANESVGWLDDLRIGHVLDPNVASAIHHSCTHNDLLPIQSGLIGVRDYSVPFDRTACDG